MTTEGRRAHALEKRESHFGSFTGTDKLRVPGYTLWVHGRWRRRRQGPPR